MGGKAGFEEFYAVEAGGRSIESFLAVGGDLKGSDDAGAEMDEATAGGHGSAGAVFDLNLNRGGQTEK